MITLDPIPPVLQDTAGSQTLPAMPQWLLQPPGSAGGSVLLAAEQAGPGPQSSAEPGPAAGSATAAADAKSLQAAYMAPDVSVLLADAQVRDWSGIPVLFPHYAINATSHR